MGDVELTTIIKFCIRLNKTASETQNVNVFLCYKVLVRPRNAVGCLTIRASTLQSKSPMDLKGFPGDRGKDVTYAV